jgi:lipoprotein-anchoring transpeptidase ErfK/SrfK
MHMPPRRSYTRFIGVTAAVLALAASTGCAQGASSDWHNPHAGGNPAAAGGSGARKAPGEFKIAPAPAATEVAVLSPVTVAAQDATLETVTVTNPDGKQVQGEFDADRKSWHTSEHLGYGKQYKVTVSGSNSAGQHIEQTSTFSTLKPRNQTQPYLQANANLALKDGATYGVGQPVIVHWDEPITDKAAAQKTLQVTTSPQVEGAWHWNGNQEVQWRPREYWKSGTSVTVKATVYGKDLGNGLYGQSDVSASFKIGQSKVAIADANTTTMQVYVDGAVVRTMPVSMGMGGETTGANGQVIDFWTRSGPHVVLGKAPVTHMTSASYGLTDKNSKFYYDEEIKQTVHISYSGEYTHLADWNIPAHGHVNTSHGCINIGPGNAEWIYDNFGPGDVVDVKNTPKQLQLWDNPGGWNMSWADWVKGSAL